MSARGGAAAVIEEVPTGRREPASARTKPHRGRAAARESGVVEPLPRSGVPGPNEAPAEGSEKRVILVALRPNGDSFVFEGVNAAFEAATGLQASAVVGRSIDQVLPRRNAGATLARCRRCVETGAPVRCLAAVPLATGRRYFAMTFTPVRNVDGAVILILGRAPELSEAEQSRAVIEESGDQRTPGGPAGPAIQFTAFPDGRPDRLGSSFFSYTGLPVGARPDEVIAAVHPDDLARLAPLAKLESDCTFCIDARVRSRDGDWRWFRVRAELVDGFAGRRWYGAATDVHQSKTSAGAPAAGPPARPAVRRGRKHAASAPAEDFAAGFDELDLLKEVSDAVAAEIALLDLQGRVVWRNSLCQEVMAALDPPMGVGDHYVDACRASFDDVDAQSLAQGLADVIEGRAPEFRHAYLDSRSAEMRWRQLHVTRVQIGSAVRLIAVHEDRTEAAQTQAALCRIGEQLLSAQEQERQRIAIELHDSTSQHLVALGLGVTRLRRLLGDGEATRDVLDDMSKSVQEAVKEVRVLSYLMKPPGLELEGLETALGSFTRGFGARTGLSVQFRIRGALEEPDLEVSHAIYRVAQEALSNVYRHAEASRVDVELACRGGSLSLRIADDGRGMDARGRATGERVLLGVGIPGMRARVAQLGGDLEIASDRTGTLVTAVVPLHLEADADAAAARAAGAAGPAASCLG